MTNQESDDRVQRLVEGVTPALVAGLFYELEPKQHPVNRGTVTVEEILTEIAKRGGYGLEERPAFERPLKKAILRALEEIREMRFVSGD